MPDSPSALQVAALPFRRGPNGVEIMLITSRETRRWVIPKGWPMKAFDPGGTAAQEAFEEAGLVGDPGRRPLGVYHYDKRLRSGRAQHVRVMVFPLKVREERDIWPEMVERERRWTTPAEAAGMVDEPELQALLARFTG